MGNEMLIYKYLGEMTKIVYLKINIAFMVGK